VGGEAHQVDTQRRHVDRDLAHGLRGVAMQQHAPLAAKRGDLGNRLDHADFVVRQHHRNQQRVVAQSRGNLRRIEHACPRAGRLFDRQDRDLESVPPQPGNWVEDRFVFGRDGNQMIAPPSGTLRHAANRQVIALRSAAGEHDFAAAGPDRGGNPLPCIFDRLLRLPAKGMAGAGRIAKLLREQRQHGLNDPRINPRRRMIVEVYEGHRNWRLGRWD